MYARTPDFPDASRPVVRPSPSGLAPSLPVPAEWDRAFRAAVFSDYLLCVVSGMGSESEAWQLLALSTARALKLVKWAASANDAVAALSRYYGVDAFPGARGTDAPIDPDPLASAVVALELSPV